MNRKRKVTLVLCFIAVLSGLFVYILFLRNDICLTRVDTYREGTFVRDAEVEQEPVLRLSREFMTALIHLFDAEQGFFIYEVTPEGDVPHTNNDIRQLLGGYALARESKDPTIRSYHEKNLKSIMSAWYREEAGKGYVYAYEKSKLGANALLLRLITKSPFFDEYQSEAEALKEGILSLVQKNGSLKPWYKAPSYHYDEDYLLTFYSGEALIALLEYAERIGDKELIEKARTIQDFYIGEYVLRMEENYYPAYVPWHTQSLSVLYEMTGDTMYRDALFTLNDTLLAIQDTTKFVGRFYNPKTPEYGSPHASSDAVYTESLAIAYAHAKEAGDTGRVERYGDALDRALFNLTSLQYRSTLLRILDDSDTKTMIEGALMTNVCERTIRIDSTAHALDALSVLMGR